MNSRHNHKLILAAAILAGATACSGDTESVIPGVGTLAVTLAMHPTMLTPDGSPTDTPVPYDIPSEEVSVSMTALDGDYSHTWPDFSAFPQADDYYAGSYLLTATAGDPAAEGYDSPAFGGETSVIIREGVRTDAHVTLAPLSSFFSASVTAQENGGVTLQEIDVHTPGGIYHTVIPDAPADSYLCLRPGQTEIYATVATASSDPLRIQALTLPATRPGALYPIDISLAEGGGVPRLRVACGDTGAEFTLDAAFFSAAPPSLIPSWHGPLTLPEGDTPATPCTATVTPGGRPLAHLYLSTSSASLATAGGYPAQADLLALTPAERSALTDAGLRFEITPAGAVSVDFTGLLGSLVFLSEPTSRSVFTLEAVDVAGISATPLPLKVITTPVDIEVTGVEPAMMGINTAIIHVSCPSPGFPEHVDVEVADPADGTWRRVPVTVVSTAPSTYDVSFTVPPGSGPVDARILYCDEIRATLSVGRSQPEFRIEVDPFASTAGVRVVAADPGLRSIITSQVNIYINGSEAPLFQRFPDEGYVSIIGLNPSTTYTFKATMMTGVKTPVFTPEIKVKTESAGQLPNADFEERDNGVIYPDLPSGGRYSQTSVEIFNWQHHTTYAQEVPKEWATTNAKTFCDASANHNTWYMQPSVWLTRERAFSNSYSVVLASVAFDPDGEPIPDYVQTGQPYLDYSPVVPHIRYRAAGKLFLGSYSFDPSTMTETYTEGIPWSSRPRSLNGYYRFIPSADNRSGAGYVRIEVLGEVDGRQTVISRSDTRLTMASDFTAFSVPLTYSMFGVKATGLRVLFSSSADCGSIADESASVVVRPDPLTATATGGHLWLDNITLAY